MVQKKSKTKWIFDTFNIIFLVSAAILCLLPFVHLLSVSLSSGTAVSAGKVGFFPIDANISSYKFIMQSSQFLRAFGIAVLRVGLGVPLNVLLVVLAAYAMSKEKEEFKARGFYAWFFIITMLFNPSLIPSYMVIRNLGMLDTMWALILPSAFPVFSMVVMLNFFRGLPKALEESASIDGATHWQVLFRIYLPLSKPSIATISLFAIVWHWNSWFDGMIYMNSPDNYPLQSYLQTVIINPAILFESQVGDMEAVKILQAVSDKTTKAAQLFVSMIPVLVIYPFLQKYFTTGLVVGSVKG